MKATLSAREDEFKKVEFNVEYYKDKSISIELFTTIKVRAKMLKEYTEGKNYSWDPEAALSAWEKNENSLRGV